MKKVFKLAAVLSVLSAVGCSTTSQVRPEEVWYVAQSCGTIAGIGLTASASHAVCATVSNVVGASDILTGAATNVATAAFLDLYGPCIAAAVQSDAHLSDTEKAQIRAAVDIALTSLDAMFAMNPGWRDDADTVNMAVRYFVLGLQRGLGQCMDL